MTRSCGMPHRQQCSNIVALSPGDCPPYELLEDGREAEPMAMPTSSPANARTRWVEDITSEESHGSHALLILQWAVLRASPASMCP